MQTKVKMKNIDRLRRNDDENKPIEYYVKVFMNRDDCSRFCLNKSCSAASCSEGIKAWLESDIMRI